MPHAEITLIATLAVALAAAFLAGMVAHRLRLPPLVGYLLAGVVIGPFTPGVVADAHLVNQLAEVGVILLMFGVGLHFSIKDLLAVKGIAVPGAIGQIAIATCLGLAASRFWGWSLEAGLIFGLSLSVASTVVLLRALGEQGMLNAVDGRIAVGWLIVEDMAMVAALVLLPAMVGSGQAGPAALASSLAWTLGKVALFVAFMLVFGSKAFPWLLSRVASTGSRELFTLAVLVTSLGVAFFAAELFGVSLALGAFFAGVVVNGSHLSHQVADDATPLQDLFAVLFFVSVGMLFNPSVLVTSPGPLVLTLAVILVGKSLAAFAIVRLCRHPTHTALIVSASLAQIGEFSFILAGLGLMLGVLPAEGHGLILAGAIFSITLNPFLFHLVDRAQRWLEGHPAALSRLEGHCPVPAVAAGAVHLLQHHAILVGHGRVGGVIQSALDEAGLPYVVIEQNAQEVERLRDRGIPALLGDAARPRVLNHAGLPEARLVIVAAPDAHMARAVVQLTRLANPDACVIVRTHSEEERHHLEQNGADAAILGEAELARAMAARALAALAAGGRGVPPGGRVPDPM